MSDRNLKIYGIASGICAGTKGAELGVWDIYYNIKQISQELSFKKVFHQDKLTDKLASIDAVLPLFKEFQDFVLADSNTNNKHLCLTGDHANGFAVWSTLCKLYNEDLGLIWVDAHLDCHTPKTTPSGNVHGMPMAHLVGEGDDRLLSLLGKKFKPENICFIGTRDYEPEELEFIKRHNIKVIFMKDISRANFSEKFQEAVSHVSAHSKHFGVSIDIDSLDPKEACATGCYNPDGLWVDLLENSLKKLNANSKFVGLEITEYNPLKEQVLNKTRNVILKLIKATFNL
jgi:arginase